MKKCVPAPRAAHVSGLRPRLSDLVFLTIVPHLIIFLRITKFMVLFFLFQKQLPQVFLVEISGI